MRMLAVIAHHGTKNRPYLDRMLASFSAMDHDVDVVILAEAPKDLPADVEVLVGLPTSDPWSLPFAHRTVFADRRDAYDLFLYSEDDTLLEQRHVDTFCELSGLLPDGLITGFQRFEEHPDGTRSYCSIHSHYHWDPTSTTTVDGLTFARLTNDHGAAYLLTRAQLERAIASGGFLVPPHATSYDMLVSAATDVYTQCGMQKVFCLERIADQLVHHLPNVYLGRLGVSEAEFTAQVETMRRLAHDDAGRERIFDPVVRLPTDVWNRHAFPVANTQLWALLPDDVRRVLSVGAASGAVESVLVAGGVDVVGVPVDRVLGTVAGLRGVRILRPSLPPAVDDPAVPFDAIMCIDVLGYLRDVTAVLAGLRPLLRPGGELLATVPDHRRYAARNLVRQPGRRVPLPTSGCGLARTDARWLRRHLEAAGFQDIHISRRHATRHDPVGTGDRAARVLGNTVVARASA